MSKQENIGLLKFQRINTAAEGRARDIDGHSVNVVEQNYESPVNNTNKDDILHRFLNLEFDKECYIDGVRQVDFVLAYEEETENVSVEGNSSATTTVQIEEEDDIDDDGQEDGASGSKPALKQRRRRENFEANLIRMGLQLERRNINPILGATRFVLIHAPFHVLERQAQLLSVKLPIKESDVDFRDRSLVPLPGILERYLGDIFDFDYPTKKMLEEPDYFTAIYSSDRRAQFVNHDREDILFPNAERSRMVYDLLTRANYDTPSRIRKDAKHFGIERLLANGTYSAAYPLHHSLRPHKLMGGPGDEETQREILSRYWASWRNILKFQPLDCIKRYFGSKIAFYFAWLGFYTRHLYIAAFVGVISVTFGLFNVDDDVVSNDICGSDGIGATEILCPPCENYCDFQRLNNSCVYAKVSYLFDNTATVIFAALMSVWATVFLEGWKRYHSEIAWKWGLLDVVVEEETVRPDFQFRVKTTRFNPVTQTEEPYLSTQKKLANFFGSGVTVLFFLCLVLAVVFGMVVYRVIVMKLLAVMDDTNIDSYAFLIVSASAALINLVVILVMNLVYNNIALGLTRWECPRTQADFDNSYTFKVFLFQFVNYYSSLFYIAFFKGLFSQLPGARDNSGNLKIGGYRLEGCDAAGCFAELVIQLATIMCGKQFFSAIVEYLYPVVMGLLRKWQLRVPVVVLTKEQLNELRREEKEKEAGSETMKRWEADYYLSPTYDQFLFDEYLEMVLQFGFVTLFVAAFPLAPLFALINNVLEIRIDASKFLHNTQRPMPAQAKNIGVWLAIMDVISKASVTINALVIAFTSDFVPKMMYYFSKGSMVGYVNYSLSYFDASELMFSRSQFSNITSCRFRGFRRMPCSLITGPHPLYEGERCDDNLGLSYEWWKVFAARLLFVVVFEHIVFFVKIVVEYLIPDVPTRIFVQQQRERYLLRKALIGDMSGTGSPMTQTERQKHAHADREDYAFQPGSFDELPNGNSSRITNNRSSADSTETFVTAYAGNKGSVLTLDSLPKCR